jgi:hypothetical protein
VANTGFTSPPESDGPCTCGARSSRGALFADQSGLARRRVDAIRDRVERRRGHLASTLSDLMHSFGSQPRATRHGFASRARRARSPGPGHRCRSANRAHQHPLRRAPDGATAAPRRRRLTACRVPGACSGRGTAPRLARRFPHRTAAGSLSFYLRHICLRRGCHASLLPNLRAGRQRELHPRRPLCGSGSRNAVPREARRRLQKVGLHAPRAQVHRLCLRLMGRFIIPVNRSVRGVRA